MGKIETVSSTTSVIITTASLLNGMKEGMWIIMKNDVLLFK